MHLNDEARLRMRPLFNPAHAQWSARRAAMEVYYIAQDTMAQRDELVKAQAEARERSLIASHLLQSARFELRYYLLRPNQTLFDPAPIRAKVRGAELAVCAAHDMLWVAQLAVALWDASYGHDALRYG